MENNVSKFEVGDRLTETLNKYINEGRYDDAARLIEQYQREYKIFLFTDSSSLNNR